VVRGRRTDNARLIDRLDLAPGAKERLQRIVATLTAQQTVVEACGCLGLSERHFHTLRLQVLQEAGRWLEGRRSGRPCRQRSDKDAQVTMLQAEIQQLRIDLQTARIREEIALTMPHLLQRSKPRKKTKTNRCNAPRPNSGGKRGT
jgi:hypothetical protein